MCLPVKRYFSYPPFSKSCAEEIIQRAACFGSDRKAQDTKRWLTLDLIERSIK
jgi:hypothetical protein